MSYTKKILENTIGVAVGSVGITEANKITPLGGVIGTTMGAGMAVHMTKSKKKGGMF